MPVTRVLNVELNVDQLPGPTQEVINVDTGERLEFWRANSLIFSVSFVDGSGDFDLSGVAKASLEVKRPNCRINAPRADFPLMMYQEIEGPFSTGSPVEFDFTADETAIPYGTQWLSVTLYGSAGERMTTVSGLVTVLGNGYGTANVPDVQDLRDQAVQAAADAADARDQSCACAQASSDEADRAQQIADNLEALSTSLSYRGVWSSSSTPPDAQRGWFWMIGEPVSFAGLTWAVGDAALYNGEVWQAVPIQWLLEQVEQDVATLKDQVMGGRNYLVLRGSGYAWIADDPALRPGLSNMTVAGWVNLSDTISNEATIFGKGTQRFLSGLGNCWSLGWFGSVSGRPSYREKNNSGSNSVNTSAQITATPPSGLFHLTLVRDVSSGEVRMHYNGELVGTDDTGTFLDLTTTVPMTIGLGVNQLGNPAFGYLANGNYGPWQMFSFALTDAEVTELYRSGVPFKYRRGAFAPATSGTLELAQEYEISNYESGDDFTNVGAGSNATGERFTATGTTPANWSNGSAVKRLGAVLNLQPEGIGAEKGQWLDSANGHHALMSVAGAYPLRQPEEYTLKFGPVDLTADVSLGGARDVIADGYDVVRVQHQNEDGSAAEDVTLSYDDGSTQTQFFAGASSVAAGSGEIGYPTITKPAGYNRIVAGATAAGASTFTLTLKRRQQ